MVGGLGNDYLSGDAGNDVYQFATGFGQDTLQEGGGTDSVQFGANLLSSNAVFSASGNDLIIGFKNSTDQLTLSSQLYDADLSYRVESFKFGDNISYTTDQIKTMLQTLGTADNDNLYGSDFSEKLYGYAGDDYIQAYGGNDTLDGGDGNDTLDGGAGNDTVTGGIGNDSLYGGDGNDTLVGGLGNDYLSGDAGNDVYQFSTGFGQDTLQEGGGTDSVQFGANLLSSNAVFSVSGNDLIIGFKNSTDQVVVQNQLYDADLSYRVESFKFGDNISYTTDQIKTMLQTLGTAGNDNLYGSDFSEKLYGYAGDDYIRAYGGNDSLDGGDGNDQLSGDDGNDTLIGGNGNDYLSGGAGNDSLDGGIGADTLYGGLGNDVYRVDSSLDQVIEYSNEGNDTVQSSISYTLGDNLENLILTGTVNINGVGNSLSNRLTGNDGNNVLNGGAGVDTMLGGLGNDIYVVDNTGDIVTELASQGTDTVQASISYTLGNNLENLTLLGNTALNGTGNTLNNVLLGNGGNNKLLGNAGDDTLNGGAGIDTLLGGLGNDTYLVDSTNDVITENLNEGLDTVQSTVSYTLGSNLENLTLAGGNAINGTGNTLSNKLVGNAAVNTLIGLGGNDTLDGGLGADKLLGGLGNDTYVVDNIGDVVTENANEGIDTVQSSITYTLGNNLENLTLLGSSALTGIGNALNNILTGNSGNNKLIGGAGLDILNGSQGNDTLQGGLGNDVYQFKLGDGLDLIQENDTTVGNVDKVKLDSTIVKSKVAFFMQNGNLQIGYQGNTTDQITIQGQTSSASSVERVELSDGTFMTNSDINKIIQSMSTYAASHSISLTSLNDVKGNQNLMNIVAAGWHT